jgi:hypothetical protein
VRKKLITKLGILGLAVIFLLSMASYSTVQEVTTHGKPDRPDKPGKPGKPKTEWIQFTGNLVGGQPVDGCCPNAGPFPEYRMTLTEEFGDIAGTYDGYLFISGAGTGRNRHYKVQFWTEDGEVGFEINGGVIDFDKWTRVLTVTFTDVLCEDWWGAPIAEVTFTLVRGPY